MVGSDIVIVRWDGPKSPWATKRPLSARSLPLSLDPLLSFVPTDVGVGTAAEAAIRGYLPLTRVGDCVDFGTPRLTHSAGPSQSTPNSHGLAPHFGPPLIFWYRCDPRTDRQRT
jgi:hypothetical protein